MSEHKNTYKTLWELLRNYIKLTIEDTKLTVAEKATVLATSAAVSVVALLFGVIIFFFVSLALAQLLATAVGLFWAYLIVAGAYLVLFVLLVVLRKQLIANPVSRFLTKLFFSK